MSEPDEPVTCDTHGESHATFVCRHVAANSGLGFLTGEPTSDPRPDAWCSACDAVRARDGEWNERSEEFAGITVICAGCYDLARWRNRSRDPVFSTTGFRCGSCDELHHELPMDFGWPTPLPYESIPDEERAARCTLTKDLCTVDEHFFIRGCLEIPVIDAPAAFVWGVWTSLSEASFRRAGAVWDQEERIQEPPYFGWLMTAIPGYPDTLSLKSHIHTRMIGMRPYVELEPTDHPLAIEQRNGITLERARALAEAMLHRAT